MKRTHTQLRDAIVAWLNAVGIFAWANETIGIWDPKRQAYRTNKKRLKGVADILGVLSDGRFLAVEVKVGKDRCSEEQQYFLQRVQRQGGIAIVARSIEDVRRLLAHHGVAVAERRESRRRWTACNLPSEPPDN